MSSLPLDEASKVTPLTELHDYQELAMLVEVVHITHNIVIMTIPEDLNLIATHLKITLTHPPYTDLLYDEDTSFPPLGLHFPCLSKSPFTNQLKFPVFVTKHCWFHLLRQGATAFFIKQLSFALLRSLSLPLSEGEVRDFLLISLLLVYKITSS